jgi:hypothetical protein
MAKAIGTARSTDTNSKGGALRSSSGSGMTFTPAKGLGASMVEDLDGVVARAKAQYAADRRAAARDRLLERIDSLLADD